MSKKITKLLLIFLILITLIFPACVTNMHIVGDGPKTGLLEQERQWYALWGLVPITKVNTKEMSKGSKDYSIKTEFTVLDIIINFFTSSVSIISRTVEVRR